jgi:hypothetical protein
MPIGTGMGGDREVGIIVDGTAGGALEAASSSDRQSFIDRHLQSSTPRHRCIITRRLQPITAGRGIIGDINACIVC